MAHQCLTTAQLGFRSRLVDNVEAWIRRPVTIEDIETQATLSRCHYQEQSPLFSLLPREIRDLIWAFATAPSEIEERNYDPKAFYCRPGHTAPLLTDFAILLTCRRIWLEANAFPMLQAEQCFWRNRPAPDHRDAHWTKRLTKNNHRNFGHLHLFAQMCNIEGLRDGPGDLRTYFVPTQHQCDFQPRVFQVTIRHTDWWYWEREADLRLRDSWVQALLDTQDLRRTHTLKLDLETLDYKVNQLLPIVDRIQAMVSREQKTHLVDGKPTSTKFVPYGQPQIQQWSGPTELDGSKYPQYEKLQSLTYHIITLTWRLHFPEYPRAHIPTLRLAPALPNHVPRPTTSRRVVSDSWTRSWPQYTTYHLKASRSWTRKPDGLWHRHERSADVDYMYDFWRDVFVLTQAVDKHRASGHEWARRHMFESRMGALRAKEVENHVPRPTTTRRIVTDSWTKYWPQYRTYHLKGSKSLIRRLDKCWHRRGGKVNVEYMHDFWRDGFVHTQVLNTHRANGHEWARKDMFEYQMGAVRAKEVEERWRLEDSLMKLELED